MFFYLQYDKIVKESIEARLPKETAPTENMTYIKVPHRINRWPMAMCEICIVVQLCLNKNYGTWVMENVLSTSLYECCIGDYG
jgi:hypothetical protein